MPTSNQKLGYSALSARVLAHTLPSPPPLALPCAELKPTLSCGVVCLWPCCWFLLSYRKFWMRLAQLGSAALYLTTSADSFLRTWCQLCTACIHMAMVSSDSATAAGRGALLSITLIAPLMAACKGPGIGRSAVANTSREWVLSSCQYIPSSRIALGQQQGSFLLLSGF